MFLNADALEISGEAYSMIGNEQQKTGKNRGTIVKELLSEYITTIKELDR